MNVDNQELLALAKLVRHHILSMTSEVGSGHPTSSLSATDLMVALLFGGFFRYDVEQPHFPNNDRLIFSKGHASPLLYALWSAAGTISPDDLKTYRQLGSVLEGHPSIDCEYVEAATGSLGQGLGIGVGMALNAKYLDHLNYRTFVLLGDGEMAEGSQWEAIQVAAHYRLNNLVAVLDVNRLGQAGETMYGHDVEAYRKRVSAFDWNTVVVDGHDWGQILHVYELIDESRQPLMVIAKTIKGKGVSFLEDKNGWHGKALKREQLSQALAELGEVDFSLKGELARPERILPHSFLPKQVPRTAYSLGESVATRKAYGSALVRVGKAVPTIIALDGEVNNSTGSDQFKNELPERFFEMYIAEQNMVATALGVALRGKIPFVTTFAAFLTRAFDQIRMSQYSKANIKYVGSHAGVAIGQDGPSQMGLEDIAMFRALLGSTVLYPCDAVSTEYLVEEASKREGIVYIRTTRGETPVIYDVNERFPIGGSKTLVKSKNDLATIVAAGVTLHEALAAHAELMKRNLPVRVIDMYSIKPIDEAALAEAARETGLIVTVEDHYAEGGLGDAVCHSLANSNLSSSTYCLAVRKKPHSGTPEQLLDYEQISRKHIVATLTELLLVDGIYASPK